MNKIEGCKIDYKLIWIINDEYNLSNLIYIYDNYILSELKKAIDNNLKTIRINLLGEVSTSELLKYYTNKKELSEHLNKLVSTKKYSVPIRLEVTMPIFGIVEKINNEADLIEIAKSIKDIEDEEELVYFYYNKIKIRDLYNQFKGKDNFIKIYKYIKNILND